MLNIFYATKTIFFFCREIFLIFSLKSNLILSKRAVFFTFFDIFLDFLNKYGIILSETDNEVLRKTQSLSVFLVLHWNSKRSCLHGQN